MRWETYEKLVEGREPVESSLHRHLVEHLNSEIVLKTISDVSVAVEWLRSTFFFVRVLSNPGHYGFPAGLSSLCMRELNGLSRYNLITMNDGFDILPTVTGSIMAKFCIGFNTMVAFTGIEGTENMAELLQVFIRAQEFSDVKLRMNERGFLNYLNHNTGGSVIKYPMKGKIKTGPMKVNVLLQASLGCLPIKDYFLTQEAKKILQIAQRVATGLLRYLQARKSNHYRCLLNAYILARCTKIGLWDDSDYISRQIPGIGPVLSSHLVGAEKTTFQAILDTNPRELERIMSRHPPMGNQIQEFVQSLPRTSLTLSLMDSNQGRIQLDIRLLNPEQVVPPYSWILLVGDSLNEVRLEFVITDSKLNASDNQYTIPITIPAESFKRIETLEAHLFNEKLVGLNSHAKLFLNSNDTAITIPKPKGSNTLAKTSPKTVKKGNLPNKNVQISKAVNGNENKIAKNGNKNAKAYAADTPNPFVTGSKKAANRKRKIKLDSISKYLCKNLKLSGMDPARQKQMEDIEKRLAEDSDEGDEGGHINRLNSPRENTRTNAKNVGPLGQQHPHNTVNSRNATESAQYLCDTTEIPRKDLQYGGEIFHQPSEITVKNRNATQIGEYLYETTEIPRNGFQFSSMRGEIDQPRQSPLYGPPYSNQDREDRLNTDWASLAVIQCKPSISSNGLHQTEGQKGNFYPSTKNLTVVPEAKSYMPEFYKFEENFGKDYDIGSNHKCYPTERSEHRTYFEDEHGRTHNLSISSNGSDKLVIDFDRNEGTNADVDKDHWIPNPDANNEIGNRDGNYYHKEATREQNPRNIPSVEFEKTDHNETYELTDRNRTCRNESEQDIPSETVLNTKIDLTHIKEDISDVLTDEVAIRNKTEPSDMDRKSENFTNTKTTDTDDVENIEIDHDQAKSNDSTSEELRSPNEGDILYKTNKTLVDSNNEHNEIVETKDLYTLNVQANVELETSDTIENEQADKVDLLEQEEYIEDISASSQIGQEFQDKAKLPPIAHVINHDVAQDNNIGGDYRIKTESFPTITQTNVNSIEDVIETPDTFVESTSDILNNVEVTCQNQVHTSDLDKQNQSNTKDLICEKQEYDLNQDQPDATNNEHKINSEEPNIGHPPNGPYKYESAECNNEQEKLIKDPHIVVKFDPSSDSRMDSINQSFGNQKDSLTNMEIEQDVRETTLDQIPERDVNNNVKQNEVSSEECNKDPGSAIEEENNAPFKDTELTSVMINEVTRELDNVSVDPVTKDYSYGQEESLNRSLETCSIQNVLTSENTRYDVSIDEESTQPNEIFSVEETTVRNDIKNPQTNHTIPVETVEHLNENHVSYPENFTQDISLKPNEVGNKISDIVETKSQGVPELVDIKVEKAIDINNNPYDLTDSHAHQIENPCLQNSFIQRTETQNDPSLEKVDLNNNMEISARTLGTDLNELSEMQKLKWEHKRKLKYTKLNQRTGQPKPKHKNHLKLTIERIQQANRLDKRLAKANKKSSQTIKKGVDEIISTLENKIERNAGPDNKFPSDEDQWQAETNSEKASNFEDEVLNQNSNEPKIYNTHPGKIKHDQRNDSDRLNDSRCQLKDPEKKLETTKLENYRGGKLKIKDTEKTFRTDSRITYETQIDRHDGSNISFEKKCTGSKTTAQYKAGVFKDPATAKEENHKDIKKASKTLHANSCTKKTTENIPKLFKSRTEMEKSNDNEKSGKNLDEKNRHVLNPAQNMTGKTICESQRKSVCDGQRKSFCEGQSSSICDRQRKTNNIQNHNPTSDITTKKFSSDRVKANSSKRDSESCPKNYPTSNYGTPKRNQSFSSCSNGKNSNNPKNYKVVEILSPSMLKHKPEKMGSKPASTSNSTSSSPRKITRSPPSKISQSASSPFKISPLSSSPCKISQSVYEHQTSRTFNVMTSNITRKPTTFNEMVLRTKALVEGSPLRRIGKEKNVVELDFIRNNILKLNTVTPKHSLSSLAQSSTSKKEDSFDEENLYHKKSNVIVSEKISRKSRDSGISHHSSSRNLGGTNFVRAKLRDSELSHRSNSRNLGSTSFVQGTNSRSRDSNSVSPETRDDLGEFEPLVRDLFDPMFDHNRYPAVRRDGKSVVKTDWERNTNEERNTNRDGYGEPARRSDDSEEELEEGRENEGILEERFRNEGILQEERIDLGHRTLNKYVKNTHHFEESEDSEEVDNDLMNESDVAMETANHQENNPKYTTYRYNIETVDPKASHLGFKTQEKVQSRNLDEAVLKASPIGLRGAQKVQNRSNEIASSNPSPRFKLHTTQPVYEMETFEEEKGSKSTLRHEQPIRGIAYNSVQMDDLNERSSLRNRHDENSPGSDHYESNYFNNPVDLVNNRMYNTAVGIRTGKSNTSCIRNDAENIFVNEKIDVNRSQTNPSSMVVHEALLQKGHIDTEYFSNNRNHRNSTTRGYDEEIACHGEIPYDNTKIGALPNTDPAERKNAASSLHLPRSINREYTIKSCGKSQGIIEYKTSQSRIVLNKTNEATEHTTVQEPVEKPEEALRRIENRLKLNIPISYDNIMDGCLNNNEIEKENGLLRNGERDTTKTPEFNRNLQSIFENNTHSSYQNSITIPEENIPNNTSMNKTTIGSTSNQNNQSRTASQISGPRTNNLNENVANYSITNTHMNQYNQQIYKGSNTDTTQTSNRYQQNYRPIYNSSGHLTGQDTRPNEASYANNNTIISGQARISNENRSCGTQIKLSNNNNVSMSFNKSSYDGPQFTSQDQQMNQSQNWMGANRNANVCEKEYMAQLDNDDELTNICMNCYQCYSKCACNEGTDLKNNINAMGFNENINKGMNANTNAINNNVNKRINANVTASYFNNYIKDMTLNGNENNHGDYNPMPNQQNIQSNHLANHGAGYFADNEKTECVFRNNTSQVDTPQNITSYAMQQRENPMNSFPNAYNESSIHREFVQHDANNRNISGHVLYDFQNMAQTYGLSGYSNENGYTNPHMGNNGLPRALSDVMAKRNTLSRQNQNPLSNFRNTQNIVRSGNSNEYNPYNGPSAGSTTPKVDLSSFPNTLRQYPNAEEIAIQNDPTRYGELLHMRNIHNAQPSDSLNRQMDRNHTDQMKSNTFHSGARHAGDVNTMHSSHVNLRKSQQSLINRNSNISGSLPVTNVGTSGQNSNIQQQTSAHLTSQYTMIPEQPKQQYPQEEQYNPNDASFQNGFNRAKNDIDLVRNNELPNRLNLPVDNSRRDGTTLEFSSQNNSNSNQREHVGQTENMVIHPNKNTHKPSSDNPQKQYPGKKSRGEIARDHLVNMGNVHPGIDNNTMRHLMEKFRSHYNPEEPPEYEYQDDERLNEEDDVEFPEVVNEDDIRPNHEAYNPYENVDYLHERTIRQAHHNLVKQSYETPLGEYAHSRTMNPNNLELHRSINRQVFKNSPRRFNARHVKDAISNATFPNYLTNQGRISNENIDVEAFPNRYTNYTTCRSERESRELLTQDDWNSQEYHSNERYPVKLQQMPLKHQYDSRNQPPWIQEERIQHQNNRRKQMPKVELPRTLQYQRNQPRRMSQQEGSQHQYNSTQQSTRIELQQQKTLQPQSDPKNQSPMIDQEVFSPNAPQKHTFQTKLVRFQYEPQKKIPLPGLKPPNEMPIHGLKEPLKQMSKHGLNEPPKEMLFHPGLKELPNQMSFHPVSDDLRNDMYSDDEPQDMDGPERMVQGDSDVSDSSVDYGRFEHNFQGSTSSPL
ncbi:hypothetical protein M8J76_007688 [Diaphorina citri]|nr:hypothetical protein M8J76_007688 [Diaphorina citri]